MFNGHSGNRIIRPALRPGFPLTVKKLENDYDRRCCRGTRCLWGHSDNRSAAVGFIPMAVNVGVGEKWNGRWPLWSSEELSAIRY